MSGFGDLVTPAWQEAVPRALPPWNTEHVNMRGAGTLDPTGIPRRHHQTKREAYKDNWKIGKCPSPRSVQNVNAHGVNVKPFKLCAVDDRREERGSDG